MIPRITIRDRQDLLYIVNALQGYMMSRLEEYQNIARRPGADRWALSIEQIEETKYVTSLLSDIAAQSSQTADQEESDQNG
jgi:hypothetical protein